MTVVIHPYDEFELLILKFHYGFPVLNFPRSSISFLFTSYAFLVVSIVTCVDSYPSFSLKYSAFGVSNKRENRKALHAYTVYKVLFPFMNTILLLLLLPNKWNSSIIILNALKIKKKNLNFWNTIVLIASW